MDNRSHILNNALRLFAARGYEAVGVQEIAAVSGLSKPTLYYYFQNKQGLLKTIIAERGEPLAEAVRRAARYQGDLSLALNRVALAFFQYADGNRLFYRMQLAMYFAPAESLANQMCRRMNEELHRLLEDLFGQAAANHNDLTGRQMSLAAAFMGTLNTYIGLALNGYIDLNEELAVNAVRQFMHGIYA